jgi:hypothetical protein
LSSPVIDNLPESRLHVLGGRVVATPIPKDDDIVIEPSYSASHRAATTVDDCHRATLGELAPTRTRLTHHVAGAV